MNERRKRWFTRAAVVIPIVVLPLVGRAFTGRELASIFAFPPREELPTGYRRFSWWAAAAVGGALAGLALLWWRAARRGSRPADQGEDGRGRFPSWGWGALVWTLGWWWLAWTRWEWFAPLQRYTFFPLWLGFIVAVNAETERCAGSCLLRRAPARWASLFGVSAMFWWGFEWLNRFVRNWHYLGVEEFGALAYAIHATLCFSTVLPAVAAVAEWLETHARWRACVSVGPRWTWLNRRSAAVGLILSGAAALVGAGTAPQGFYPALWSAPLLLAAGIGALTGPAQLLSEIANGRWRRAVTWMAAALICGFFWEMWNYHSAAKWIYTVPGVERWRVFEMPLLGYSGYLPFGLECMLAAEWCQVESSSLTHTEFGRLRAA